jgi:hypothetical protein
MSDAVSAVPQLWPFLLELLTRRDARQLIRWVSAEGEFEFVEPEQVARLWGEQKANANMTFAKLSRALRNYYSLGIVAKVGGPRAHTYRFTFDLAGHLGYSVAELCALLGYEAQPPQQDA